MPRLQSVSNSSPEFQAPLNRIADREWPRPASRKAATSAKWGPVAAQFFAFTGSSGRHREVVHAKPSSARAADHRCCGRYTLIDPWRFIYLRHNPRAGCFGHLLLRNQRRQPGRRQLSRCRFSNLLLSGVYPDDGFRDHGFLWDQGMFTTIDVPGAFNTFAFSRSPDD
jgi:hypothetical protein